MVNINRLGWLAVVMVLTSACSDPRVHPAPNEMYFQVGLFGHGRGVLGDLELNYFGLQRRCDSCHANKVDSHGDLGTCNRCHQPSFLGWPKTLFATRHASVFSFKGETYHQSLACVECHQDLSNEQSFKILSCNHCHNHGRSDIDYAHDLLDEYSYPLFSKDTACVSCHSKSGKNYSNYHDMNTHELL